MRLVFSAAALIGCAFATVALAQTGEATPAEVQWVRTPSAALDPYYRPERALRLEVSGDAVLKCEYDARGLLGPCSVVSEDPAKFGFGIAALHMAPAFKLKPTLSDGSPLKPGEITFPVPFRLEPVRRR